jgi:hypothetical protein
MINTQLVELEQKCQAQKIKFNPMHRKCHQLLLVIGKISFHALNLLYEQFKLVTNGQNNI